MGVDCPPLCGPGTKGYGSVGSQGDAFGALHRPGHHEPVALAVDKGSAYSHIRANALLDPARIEDQGHALLVIVSKIGLQVQKRAGHCLTVLANEMNLVPHLTPRRRLGECQVKAQRVGRYH